MKRFCPGCGPSPACRPTRWRGCASAGATSRPCRDRWTGCTTCPIPSAPTARRPSASCCGRCWRGASRCPRWTPTIAWPIVISWGRRRRTGARRAHASAGARSGARSRGRSIRAPSPMPSACWPTCTATSTTRTTWPAIRGRASTCRRAPSRSWMWAAA